MKKFLLSIVTLIILHNVGYCQKLPICLTEPIKYPKKFDTSNFGSSKAVADNYYYWDNGATIYIKFLNGSYALQEKCKPIIKLWERYANIHFQFVPITQQSNIRVSFDDKEVIDVAIGTMANLYPQSEANTIVDTTCFGNGEKMQAVLLHLFGHVLGLEDEILSSSAAYTSILKSQFKHKLNKEKILLLEKKYQENRLNALNFDKYSIMAWPLDGKLEYKTSTSWFSKQDKRVIDFIYPKKPTRINYDTQIVKPTFSFQGLKIVTKGNANANGVSFYPQFRLTNQDRKCIIYISIELLDADKKFIGAIDDTYQINNHLGSISKPINIVCSGTSTNVKDLLGIEIFFPNEVIIGSKPVYAIFKAFYFDAAMQMIIWLHISKTYAIPN